MPPRSRLRPLLVLAALLVGVACSSRVARTPAAAEPPPGPVGDLEARVLLIGDAGGAEPGDPVLAVLAREISAAPERTLVVFLGDNIYPAGLAAPGSRRRADDERHLDQQLAAVRGSGATTVFVPGNHDWDNSGEGGWDAVRRQQEYVAAHGGPRVLWSPPDGCPGPQVHDLEERVRVVVLDTQWWLHSGPRPLDPDSLCEWDSEPEVLDALRGTIAGAGGRRVVVVGHHPLASGGPHGGHFDWRDHIFPLRVLKGWLWLPLPVIGSIYPIARQSGITDQDFSGERNRHMRAALEGVFAEHPPLAFAAGHEHSLQVIEGEQVPWLLVSGAGYFDHLTPLGSTPRTLFEHSRSGFMRLDVGRSGRVRLGVLEVSASGASREVYARDLAGAGIPDQKPKPARR